jgi:transposase InsO family protein
MRATVHGQALSKEAIEFPNHQGVQYKSNKYRKLLWRYGVMQSRSRIQSGDHQINSPFLSKGF